MYEFQKYIKWIDVTDMYIRFDINVHKNTHWKNMIKIMEDRENMHT